MSNLHFFKTHSFFLSSNTVDKICRKFGRLSRFIICGLLHQQTENFNQHGYDVGVSIADYQDLCAEFGLDAQRATDLLNYLLDANWLLVNDGSCVRVRTLTADILRHQKTCKINSDKGKKSHKKNSDNEPLSTDGYPSVNRPSLLSSTLILSKSNLNSESNSNPSNYQERTTTCAREAAPETSSSKLPTDEDFLGWDDPPQPVSETLPPEPPKPTKTPKLGSAKPSGASRIERKAAAIERLIQETSKPLWFTGSEPINELRRFLEICQAKKKIPKMASTVGGWIAQYQALDEFMFSVKESIRNEWCTLLPRSDILKKMGRWKFGKEVVQQRYVQPRPPPQRPPERERTPEEKEQDRIAAEEARKKLHELVNMKNLANSLDMNRFLKSKMN